MTQKEYFELDNNHYDELRAKGLVELSNIRELGNNMQANLTITGNLDEFLSRNSLFIIAPEDLPILMDIPTTLHLTVENEYRHMVVEYKLLKKSRNFWMSRNGLRTDVSPKKTILFVDGYKVLSDVTKNEKKVTVGTSIADRIKAAQKMEKVIDDLIKNTKWNGTDRSFSVKSNGDVTDVWFKSGDIEYHKKFDKDGNEIIKDETVPNSDDASVCSTSDKPTDSYTTVTAKNGEDTAVLTPSEVAKVASDAFTEVIKGLHNIFKV